MGTFKISSVYSVEKQSALTPSVLRDLLTYDEHTGIFTWRERPRRYFTSDRIWCSFNSRFSGVRALATPLQGYLAGGILGYTCLAHRVAWAYEYDAWPTGEIDHENHIKTDNRIVNLREVSTAGNRKNRSMNANNASGVCGVYWHSTRRRWIAQIRVDTKTKYLGSFRDIASAQVARAEGERVFGFHRNHGQ